MYRIFFITTFVIIGLVLTSMYNTNQHENIHKIIQEYYGCKNSKVVINIFTTSYTECIEYNHNQTQDEVREEYLLHSINEIIGYNVTTIIVAILWGSLAIALSIALFSSELLFSWRKK